MSRLERRYRSLLRMLPAWYRAERKQEMVDAFLADADDIALEYGWPRWSETASVASLALRTRFGGAGVPERYLQWGEAARLVALLGLLAQAMTFGGSLVNRSRQYLAGDAQMRGYIATLTAPKTLSDWSQLVMELAPVIGVAALVALALGYRRTGRVLTLCMVAAWLASGVQMALWLPSPGMALILVADVLAWVPALAVLTGFHAKAPQPARPLRWLLSLPLGMAAYSGLLTLPLPPPVTATLAVSVLPAALVGGAAWYAASLRLSTSRPRASWPLALATIAGVLSLRELVLLTNFAQLGALISVTSLATLAVLVTVGAALAVAGERSLPAAAGQNHLAGRG